MLSYPTYNMPANPFSFKRQATSTLQQSPPRLRPLLLSGAGAAILRVRLFLRLLGVACRASILPKRSCQLQRGLRLAPSRFQLLLLPLLLLLQGMGRLVFPRPSLNSSLSELEQRPSLTSAEEG